MIVPKEWECRERKKDKERHYGKAMVKERVCKRRMEILRDEEENDDDSRSAALVEKKRKKRLHEKEDYLADRQKEEEEIMVTEQDNVAD
ncbi:hypothetical protein RIF29_33055 [Crotalaria pallida]|uniref:Uncharacterized protein n=1 Tax=Crotalaria pallida TaxID=3830 RepID=A0AAN9E7D0_CROPI